MIVGAAAGGGYAAYKAIMEPRPTQHMEHEKHTPIVLDQHPRVKIIRKITNENDKSGLQITLFQYQTCPFCCKVRAFLDYHGISYNVVEVDAVRKRDLKWSTTKKVPTMLVQTNDKRYLQLNDSSVIVSVLASYLQKPGQDIVELASYYPNISYFDDRGKKTFETMNKYFLMCGEGETDSKLREHMERERKWRNWVDIHLVHMISPNVYRNTREAIETFEWFSETGEWGEHFSAWEKYTMMYVGAAAMWGISKLLKKRHGLSDDVRSHIYDACNDWTKELERRQSPFMGGPNPDLSDLAAFGVLNSMEGCAAWKDCLNNTKIGPWFNQMKQQVINNRGHVVKFDRDSYIG